MMKQSRLFRLNRRLFLTLAVLEIGLITVVISGYRTTYKPDLVSFVSSPPGWAFIIACFGSCLAVWYCICLRNTLENGVVGSTIAVNLLLILMLAGAGEFIPRYLSVTDLAGEHIGRLLLRPRPWRAVVHRYSAMLDKFESKRTFFVDDPLLGWTVGPDRRSPDELMYSDKEGIRVRSVGEREPDPTAKCRIAIVGDSFALAEGVMFEETWGAYLEQDLAPRCRVMNFGVSGYSIGQMYLRLKRDVLPHRPDVVIMAFTDGALDRTMGVYGFLMMTDSEWPWAQPRFVLRGQELVTVNMPLPRAREIYSASSIREVPYISYDRWYLASEWEQRHWDLAYLSYGFRWITSLYPIYEGDRSAISDDSLLAVNVRLIQSFHQLSIANGAVPIVLYLPKRDDYGPRKRPPWTHGLMKQQGMDFVDATGCVGAVEPNMRFVVTNFHYSARGNQAVARCVLPTVQSTLANRSSLQMGEGEPAHG